MVLRGTILHIVYCAYGAVLYIVYFVYDVVLCIVCFVYVYVLYMIHLGPVVMSRERVGLRHKFLSTLLRLI